MKKYLSIFLIFFLLFGASVPAFASTTSDIVPPVLDPTQYDSYLIGVRSYTDGTTDYNCILYHSSDWYVYTPEGRSSVKLFSLSDSPKVLYLSTVSSTDYDASTSNNGWGMFSQHNYHLKEWDDGTTYKETSLQGTLAYSNKDVPYASLDFTNKLLINTGGFFFTLTPPLVLATEEALNQFQNQTSQTILTIVLCGVGCLALLIGLNLLRKVLPRFLNR